MVGLIKLDQSRAPVVIEPFDVNKSMLKMLRDQYKALNSSEFDQFIATASSMGLNPIKRQIAPIIFNANKPEKRQMALVTTIMGLRAIADRTGCYRPDPKNPIFERDEELISSINPLGIISCSVFPQKHTQGEWSNSPGQVFWDEIAPIIQYGSEPARLDKRTPWPNRPRGQIAKCAEADALRRGWPEDFSNIYVEDEVQRNQALDSSPSEIAEAANINSRLDLLSTQNTITMIFGTALETIPIGKVYDRCDEFINLHSDNISLIRNWHEVNKVSLRNFWAWNKSDALELNKKIEDLFKSDAAQKHIQKPSE